MAHPKILNHFTLWDIMLAKLRLHEKKVYRRKLKKMKKQGMKPPTPVRDEESNMVTNPLAMSPKDKLKFLCREMNDLAQEFSNMWRGCCEPLPNPKNDDDDGKFFF